ncbi:MAG: sterol desaturase family protein [Pseudomonadota bacterium]
MFDFLITYNRDIVFAITFGSIAVMLLVEHIKPRRAESDRQTSRWLNNISLSLFNIILMAFVSAGVGSLLWKFSLQPEHTLIEYFELNLFSATIITFMLLEFVYYWFHRLMHKIPAFWRIHAVHHCDTEIDVTTTHRHHPLEPILVLIISLPVILLLGPPIIIVVFYNLLRIIISSFSHSNIFIPKAVDYWLQYFIITPDFHRLHHVSYNPYTDSNYGSIVPWFDYLFGSATKLDFNKQKTIQLGLSYFRDPLDSRIDHLLLIPFRWKK